MHDVNLDRMLLSVLTQASRQTGTMTIITTPPVAINAVAAKPNLLTGAARRADQRPTSFRASSLTCPGLAGVPRHEVPSDQSGEALGQRMVVDL